MERRRGFAGVCSASIRWLGLFHIAGRSGIILVSFAINVAVLRTFGERRFDWIAGRVRGESDGIVIGLAR